VGLLLTKDRNEIVGQLEQLKKPPNHSIRADCCPGEPRRVLENTKVKVDCKSIAWSPSV